MFHIGDKVQLGNRIGAIQRWAIEEASPNRKLPYRWASRKRALESGRAMVELWFGNDETEVWPLAAVFPAHPAAKLGDAPPA